MLQEGITLINIYAPNPGAPKSVKQILTDIKREIDNNTVLGDFNHPTYYQWTDHLDRKSIRQ